MNQPFEWHFDTAQLIPSNIMANMAICAGFVEASVVNLYKAIKNRGTSTAMMSYARDITQQTN
jgi:hypothetical protein